MTMPLTSLLNYDHPLHF